MYRTMGRAVICGLSLLVLSGCVEATATITLNPDGRGKVVEEVLIPVPAGLEFFGGQGAKEKSLDEIRQEQAVGFVTKAKNVSAWKDVSVNWAQDGRLRMAGTAYFDKMVDISTGGGQGTEGESGPLPAFEVKVDKGEMRIAGKKNEKMKVNKAPTPDFAKMSDKDMDEYVLRQRINYQTFKAIAIMFFTDLKFKMVMRLPGEVQEVKGFKKNSQAEVSFTLDGNEMLQGMKKYMTQDTATLKRVLKSGGQGAIEGFGLTPEVMEPSMTVKKMGKALFDYDKELKEARAAYPQLRKQLNLPEGTKLPGEK